MNGSGQRDSVPLFIGTLIPRKSKLSPPKTEFSDKTSDMFKYTLET